jgi:hypothetical protein
MALSAIKLRRLPGYGVIWEMAIAATGIGAGVAARTRGARRPAL